MTERKPETGIRLKISPELKAKLHREHILEEEIADVIAFCEEKGRKIALVEKGTFSGYRQIGHMTYWVEYKPLEASCGAECGAVGKEFGRPESGAAAGKGAICAGGAAADKEPDLAKIYELVNVYSHRMQIDLEAVWNGKKIDTDV